MNITFAPAEEFLTQSMTEIIKYARTKIVLIGLICLVHIAHFSNVYLKKRSPFYLLKSFWSKSYVVSTYNLFKSCYLLNGQ